MKITQAYELLNDLVKEVLGKEDIKVQDMSSYVDIGKEVLDSSQNVETYSKKLVDRIGRTIFVDREYKGMAPNVYRDGWEWGSIMQKIDADIPQSVKNDTWALTDGTNYSMDTFHAPTVFQKFYNSKTTFEVDMSFVTEQLKQSFTNIGSFNAFASMLENRIKTRRRIDYDDLIMGQIATMIAGTVQFETNGTSLGTKSGIRAVNLLKLYKDHTGDTTMTAAKAITDLGFLKFASSMIKKYSYRMQSASSIFNIGGRIRFTPKDKQHLVLHSDFKTNAEYYLQSDTFHDDFVKLIDGDTVPFWQGTGKTYAFSDTSSIHTKFIDPTDMQTQKELKVSNILGCLFDHDALGVTNERERVNTHFNGKADFVNNFYKSDAAYFVDYNENFVVFYMA